VKERPEFVRELLRIVTAKLIAYLDFCAGKSNFRRPGSRLDDDLAVSLSAEHTGISCSL